MRTLLSIALALIILLSLPTAIFAAEKPLFETNQTQFLLQTSPAKTLNETLVIHSLSDQPQTIKLTLEGYKLKKNQFIDELYLTKHSIDFAALPQNSVELQPFAIANVDLGFPLPESLTAGDYYGILTLTSGSAVENISFTIRILGTLTEKVTVDQINNSGNSLVYKVTNKGNITTQFSINTKIDQIFFNSFSLNSPQMVIRAGEIKIIKLAHKSLLPGFYQTQTTLKFGSKNTESTSLYSFWVNSEFFWVSLLTASVALFIFILIRRSRKNV